MLVKKMVCTVEANAHGLIVYVTNSTIIDSRLDIFYDPGGGEVLN